ncbi:RB-associated KRAB zinc finger protein-like [Lytechinus pictus]|uniref:RB-associated KRAB zinc finger protein-like n=1 Tax=Lytechinus pictus TaxID=7653 RepID=UPI0030B9BB7D
MAVSDSPYGCRRTNVTKQVTMRIKPKNIEAVVRGIHAKKSSYGPFATEEATQGDRTQQNHHLYQTSLENKEGEREMQNEQDMDFVYIERDPKDESFKAHVLDAAVLSSVKASDLLHEENQDNLALERPLSDNKIDECNNMDSMAVQDTSKQDGYEEQVIATDSDLHEENQDSPMLERPLTGNMRNECNKDSMELKATEDGIEEPILPTGIDAKQTSPGKNDTGDTMIRCRTDLTKVNGEKNGSLSSLSGDVNSSNASENVLTESSSSKANMMAKSKRKTKPLTHSIPHISPDYHKISFVSENSLKIRFKKRDRQSQCSICKRFFKISVLNAHMRTHSNKKRHQCPQCGRRFRVKNTLIVHMRTHSGEKPYECSVCGRRFSQSGALTTHLKTHSDEKAYQCSECGRRFTLRYTLIIHMRTHSGEKPYECPVCQKRFSQCSGLATHKKTHVRKEKPFQCPLCLKRVSNKESLDFHFANEHTLENP